PWRSLPMPRILKHLLVAFVIVLLAGGCSGGGCSCAGVTPLPGGFDPMQRIENSASVRLTDSGVQFMQSNLGVLAKALLGGMANGGMITFAIPETKGSPFLGTDYDVCPGGPDPANNKCIAEVDLGNAQLTITPSAPYDLKITGTIPIRVQDLPID